MSSIKSKKNPDEREQSSAMFEFVISIARLIGDDRGRMPNRMSHATLKKKTEIKASGEMQAKQSQK